MNRIKYIALLLVFSLAILPLILSGCAEKEVEKIDFDEESGELPPVFGNEQLNFNGKDFVVLTKIDHERTQMWNVVDLVIDDNLGDTAIVNAVEIRNEKIKKYFGANIKRIAQDDTANFANNVVMRNEDTYNAFMLAVSAGTDMAFNGTLVDFNADVEYINLSEPWWDNAIIDTLLLYGGAYIALGDLTTLDDDATWCVLFNKDLWEAFSSSPAASLYDLVKEGIDSDGGWTIDRLKQYSKTYYRDDESTRLNKYDPSYTGNGTYGLLLQNLVAPLLMQSSGCTPTKVNLRSPLKIDDNIPGNDQFFTAIQKVFDFMGGTSNGDWLVNMDNVSSSGDKYQLIARPGFKADKFLFYITPCGTIDLIRDMETDFGILPVPKLFEDQQFYSSTIQYDCAQCYVVPYNVNEDENEFAAYILEAMAYYSSNEYNEKECLKYAYYDTVLQRKATRDDESWDMLDLVFEHRIFDIACALNLSTINTIIMNNTTGASTQFSSSYAGVQSLTGALSAKLEKLILSQQ